MDTEFSKDMITEENLKIYVIPAEDRHTDEDFDPESIELNWCFHEFQNKDLTVNVSFSEPREISPLVI
jgi:hypothetical protein